MTEKIDSQELVPKKEVQGAYVSRKSDSWRYDIPEILRLLLAAAVVAAVSWFCIDVVFSNDPELKQFKQAAFTVITGFGSGAIGFAFGVFSSKNNSN